MSEMNIYGGPAYEDSVSATTLDASIELGARRVYKGEEYVYCYNAGGSSINTGYGANLITACSGYSIAGTGLTDTCIVPVGVRLHSTMVTDAYGWIMTKGWCTIFTSNSVITGDHVVIGPAAAVAGKGGAFGLAANGAAGTNMLCGYALNCNTASAGSAYAFIRTGF